MSFKNSLRIASCIEPFDYILEIIIEAYTIKSQLILEKLNKTMNLLKKSGYNPGNSNIFGESFIDSEGYANELRILTQEYIDDMMNSYYCLFKKRVEQENEEKTKSLNEAKLLFDEIKFELSIEKNHIYL